MQVNPGCWFEIYVADMARAKSFYQGVFGGTLEKLANVEMEMWAFPMSMDKMGAAGALVKMEGMDPGGNSVIIYFSCEDCAVEEARVTKFGGRVQAAKMSIGQYGYISLVIDSEGNMIGLHSLQ